MEGLSQVVLDGEMKGTRSRPMPARNVNVPGDRREYSSPVRQQRAAATRERIIEAGAELAHEQSSWNWDHLTFRAVAERAAVGERTVYRHFPSERLLHGAIMQRLNQHAGVDYEEVDLDGLGQVAARIFASLGDFAAARSTPRPDDDAFRNVDAQRRAALLRAVQAERPQWTQRRQEDAAAALDVLWHVPSFEHLVRAWGMSTSRAADVMQGLIELEIGAIQNE